MQLETYILFKFVLIQKDDAFKFVVHCFIKKEKIHYPSIKEKGILKLYSSISLVLGPLITAEGASSCNCMTGGVAYYIITVFFHNQLAVIAEVDNIKGMFGFRVILISSRLNDFFTYSF